jgi:hypothetical protein
MCDATAMRAPAIPPSTRWRCGSGGDRDVMARRLVSSRYLVAGRYVVDWRVDEAVHVGGRMAHRRWQRSRYGVVVVRRLTWTLSFVNLIW